jgi:hypothetical protein
MQIKVTGIAKLNRDLRALGIEVGDLKAAMTRIAAMAARSAAGFAPKRSGKLAASVRGNKAKNRAVVIAGRGKSRLYAGPVNYGWPAHNIRPQPFMQAADKAIGPKVVPILQADLNRLIRAKGLQ